MYRAWGARGIYPFRNLCGIESTSTRGRSLQQAAFAKGDVRVSSVWSRHRLRVLQVELARRLAISFLAFMTEFSRVLRHGNP